MKNVIILIVIAFFGCKNESRTAEASQNLVEIGASDQGEIDPSVYQIWNAFIESNPQYKNEEIPNADFFHNKKKDADRLAELTRKGKKQAASGLLKLYQKYNVALPKAGKMLIVTNYEGKAQAIVETIEVKTIPFNEITADYAALDMATNLEPLQKWRKAHWDFFEEALKQLNQEPNKEMLVVCEKFKTIWAR